MFVEFVIIKLKATDFKIIGKKTEKLVQTRVYDCIYSFDYDYTYFSLNKMRDIVIDKNKMYMVLR